MQLGAVAEVEGVAVAAAAVLAVVEGDRQQVWMSRRWDRHHNMNSAWT